MEFKNFEYDIDKTPQQGDFIFSEARYPGYWGGFANGKTFALCLRAWLHSLKYPNNRGVLCRALVKELKDTTRHEFFHMIGCNETTISKHPYVDRWSGQEDYLRLVNGSEIYFRHLQDEHALAALLSLSIRWFGIDQAEEVPREAFLTLISRIGRTDIDTQTGERLPPAWGATVGNPAGHNWNWEYWKRNADKDGYSMGKKFHLLEATSFEGPFVTAEYLESLRELYSDRWYKRYVLGSWEADGGRIYDEFTERTHVIDPIPIEDSWKMGLGIDLGYNHPTAVVWVAIDYLGNWIVYDEHVGTEMLPMDHAPIIKAKGIRRDDGTRLVIYAPHDAMNRNPITGTNLQRAYYDEGIYLNVGNKMNPVVRIQRIKQQMRIRPDVMNPFTGQMGSPKFFITKNCPKTIESLLLYKWKELKANEEGKREQPDEVIKVNDDPADALGYWAMGSMARVQPVKEIPKKDIMFSIQDIIKQDLLGDEKYYEHQYN